MLKLIQSNHYHIWTDALHARALAHQTSNKWDRGTYIRWTVITAWITFEIACQDALDDPDISRRFKSNLDEAVKKKSLPKLDWSKGIWSQVLLVLQYRKDCVHRFSSQEDPFPDVTVADHAIGTIRQAIIQIYNHVKKPVPDWVNDDRDQGWASKTNIRIFGNAYELPPGLDQNGPDTIKITYTYKGREHIGKLLYAGTDPNRHVEELINTIGLPISAIKVYKGPEIIQEIQFPEGKIRGT